MTKKEKKRSVRAGPEQTRKRPGRRRVKLSSKHALEMASRRARVAELAASGKDLRECESLLKEEGFLHADHSTIGRDLRRERDRLNQATLLTVARHRDQLTKNLLSLEQVVRERGLQHDDYVPDLLAIFNQLAKLVGANAATRVAVVAMGAGGFARHSLYRRVRSRRSTNSAKDAVINFVGIVDMQLSSESTYVVFNRARPNSDGHANVSIVEALGQKIENFTPLGVT